MNNKGNERGKNWELFYKNSFNNFKPFVEIIALFDYIIIRNINEILNSWFIGKEGGWCCWLDDIIL